MSSRKLAIATVAAAVAGVTTAPVHAGSDTTPVNDLDVACDAWFQRVGLRQSLGLAQAFGEDPDVGAWFADEILPLTLQVAQHVPGELAEEAAIAVDLTEQVAATGDLATLEQDAAAIDAIAGYLFDNCDGSALNVTMSDYTFGSVPDSLPAGRIMFELSVPADAEWHEMVVIGLDAPISTVLEAAAEAAAADPTAGVRVLAEALRQGEPVDTGLAYRVMPVYSLPAGPGDSVITGGTFEPGEYALLCAFGEGTTAADLIIPRLLEALTDPEVHTHADLGMLHVFTVE